MLVWENAFDEVINALNDNKMEFVPQDMTVFADNLNIINSNLDFIGKRIEIANDKIVISEVQHEEYE